MPEARTADVIEAELMSLPDRNEAPEIDDAAPSSSNPPAASPAEPSSEEIAAATRKGWSPKSEFTGDPSKWVDAKTFIDRGERFNHNLQREVSVLKKRLEDFEGTRKAFVKFHEETIQKKDNEIAATIKQLRIQRSEAIGDGEHESAVALEDQIEGLQQERKTIKEIPVEAPTREAGPRAEDPVLLEWIDDGNQWFNTDAPLRAYAISVGEDLIAKGETVRGRRFLDKVASLMAEEFPRKFAKATSASATPNPMDGGSAGTSNAPNRASVNGKSERDLPDRDLQLMRQYIKEGWTTKEKFLQSYFSR